MAGIDRTRLQEELLALLLQEGGRDVPALERHPRPARLPLSFAQERLWFLHKWDTGNPVYNMPAAFRLTGQVRLDALERAFDTIIQRHEVLRTSFAEHDGQAVQVIAPALPVPLRVTDLSELPSAHQAAEVETVVLTEARAPFALDSGPLLRVHLVRLSPPAALVDDYVLLVTMHHIVSDGWSMGLLAQEFSALYARYCQDPQATSPLPELRWQYADFALWQRSWFTGAIQEAQERYWLAQLAGAPPLIALPTDHPRPAVQRFQGRTLPLTLDAPLIRTLTRIGQQEGASLYMVLLSAFAVLLQRYSDQDDIVIGAPIANRTRQEFESLIGCFANTLALRVDLAGDPPFVELLQRVRRMALDAYAHQDMPFERLVDVLAVERDLRYTPLTQVVCALQPTGGAALQVPGLQLLPLAVDNHSSKFDLSMLLEDTGEGVRGDLEFNTDLFDPGMMTRLLGHFSCLLEGVAGNPRRRLSALPLLRATERAQVLALGTPARATFVPDACLHTLFEQQAARRPDDVAVVCGEQSLTYGRLNEQANQVAHYLRRVGVGPESRVGLYCERSCELIVGLLGILKAGGAYLPIDVVYPLDRIAFMLADGGVAAVLTVQALKPNLPSPSSVPVLCLDSEWETLATQPRVNPLDRPLPGHPAYVIYTSGSTGRPKGVVVTHDNVVRLFRATENWYRFDHRDVWTLFHSPSFDFSVWEVWGALLYGGRLVVVPYLTSRSPEAFYDVLHREQVTVLSQTPSAFRQLIEAEASVGVRPLALRFVVFGGEALDVRSLRPWFERHGDQVPRLINMYGITETTVHVTYRPMTSADLTSPASVIGVLIPDLQLYLLDRSLEPVPSGVAGEIYVGGAGVARGYLGRPDLTAERMLPDPFSNRPGERLYRTGDLARYRADGEIEYLGRGDQQVKIRGFRIELGEIEALLASHPSVREAVVIAWEKAADDRRLVAYVVAAPGSTIEGLELRRFLKARLPDYMVPAIYVPLDTIPLTSNGKLNTRALPLPQQARSDTDAGFAAPRTPVEQQLAEIWAQALGVKQVGIHDGFFDLGGDSIRSIRVLAAARQQGLDFSLQQLFQYQTIAELAPLASSTAEPEPAVPPFGLISPDDRELLPSDVVDAYPLTRLQAGMLFHTELRPADAIYHDVFSFHLRAPLDLAQFQNALQAIIRRHAILRTSFALTGVSQPMQLVHDQVTIDVPVDDLQHLTAQEQEAWIGEWVTREEHFAFDWTQAPLLRVHICRRSAETFNLGISFHHALLDGWSLASVLTEFFQQYFLLLGQHDQPLPSLRPTQFRDFVAHEQRMLRSDAQRQHWAAYLGGAETSRIPRWPQMVQAPGRPAGNRLDVPLTPAISERLKHVAETAGVPLKSVLFAVHLRVLQALTNRRDVLTGLVTNVRLETEGSDRVAGLFLNTLPVRFGASAGSWLEMARAACEAEQHLLPFRWFPFAEIQQVAGQPIVLDTAFNFIHFHVYQDLVGVGDIELLGEQFFEQTNFPLIATFQQDPFSQRLHLTLYHDPAQFGVEQMTAIGGYYARALGAIADDPHRACLDHSVLSSEERQTILVDWNRTDAPVRAERLLHQWFEACAARTPDAPTVRCEGTTLTYAELNARANQVAHYLREAGVGPDVIVGLCLERSLELVVGMLGILKAGGAYLPLDHQYPRERLAFMLADATVPVVLAHTRLLPSLPPDAKQVICLDAAWPEIVSGSPENHGLSVQPEHLAYVLYTSGSTGTPKGVMIPHRAICNHMAWMAETFPLIPTDRVLQKTPAIFDASVWEFWAPLLAGAQLVLARPGGHQDPSYLVQTVQAEHITILQLVPSLLQVLLHTPGIEACTSLRRIFSGGEALTAALRDRVFATLPAELYNLYGPTEAAIDTITWHCRRDDASAVVPLGRPVANTQAYILDDRLQPVPPAVIGELYLGGESVGRGYLRRPDLTAASFLPNPFHVLPPDGLPASDAGGHRLYRTGDLARYWPDGTIEYAGRVDHQVKVRGFRIELGEVEAALGQCPGVRNGVVVARMDRPEDQRLVAYLEPTPATPFVVDEARSRLRRQLPEHMIPSDFVVLPELPRTPGGKIDRRALPAPGAAAPPPAEYVAPRTLVEDLLATIWADVLGLERVSVQANFFELGGHSLLATQVISRVREALQIDLPLWNLFETPTIAGLAATITGIQQLSQGLAAPPILPVPRDASLPLSFAQERLWFLEQLAPGNPFYNTPATLRFTGPLDADALERSLNAIVDRHEALRTVFATVAGAPEQVIRPSQPLSLGIIDLQHVSEPQRTSEIVRVAHHEAQRPFDLERGPLLRALLLRAAPDDHVLVLTIHHIVSDAWSIGVFLRELAACYNACVTGQQVPLPTLPIQYADFAAWQRQWLSGNVLDTQLAYWKEQLRGAPPVFELPADRPRPSVHSFRGQAVTLTIEPELVRQLRVVSQQAGVSLYMTLLAAYAVLLSRSTWGVEDVVIGAPIANRTRQELESLIGFFVNIIPLRVSVPGNPLFTDVLRRVRHMALDAYAHQDVPFEQLVQELQPERDMTRNPLVQVSLAYHNVPLPECDLAGVRLTPVETEISVVRFDLEVHLWDTPDGGLRGPVVYYAEVFDAATIQRLVTRFLTLLAGIAANPRQAIAALPLCPDDERERVLVAWNQTAQDVAPEACLHHLIEGQVDETPDAVAVRFDDRVLTYQELDGRANQLARHLQALGVGPDVVVAVCLERSVELVIALLGVVKAGGAYLPLDPDSPAERMRTVVTASGAAVALTVSHLQDRLPAGRARPVCLDADWPEIAGYASTRPSADVRREHLAYVLFTSGSTGAPKGVMIPHGAISNHMQWMASEFPLQATDRVLQKTPYGFDASVWEFWAPLMAGAELVMARPGGHQDPTYLVQAVQAHRITILQLVPSVLQVLLDTPGVEACTSLRRVFCGGEALSGSLRDRVFAALPAELINLYGPTEATIDTLFWRCARDHAAPTVPIGRPVANTQVYVLDRRFRPVPAGVPGELYLGGAQLARGYLGRPDLSAERFVPNPFFAPPASPAHGEVRGDGPGGRLYATGDVAAWQTDGSVVYLGRSDHQIKLRGFRIELGEIEASLRDVPGVRDAVVVVREDQPGHPQLVAYVIPEREASLAEDALRQALAERLPGYMTPATYVLLSAFPLTAHGKVDRPKLPPPESRVLTSGPSATQTPTQSLVESVWAHVLGLERIDTTANFFELGGHSLSAMQVLARVRDVFHLDVPIKALFDAPSLADFAAHIDAARSVAQGEITPPIPPTDRQGLLPLSFAQERLWFLQQLVPGNPFYTVPMAVRWQGPLDQAVLTRVLTEVVRRHEVLRTTFTIVDGQPRQAIQPPAPVALRLIDLQSCAAEEQTQAIDDHLHAALQRTFDLTTGPLFEFTLISVAPAESVLVAAMHHIATDGWSVGVFAHELTVLYEAFNQGQPSPLPELRVQYGDFAVWQRAWLQGEVLSRQRQYWQRHLRGAPEVLELPGDYPRPRLHTFRGRTIPIRIEPGAVRDLRRISQQVGASLYMTLLTGFAILLARSTRGTSELVVSAPIAHRQRQELEPLIGFFVNTLALRLDVSGDPTVEDLLRRIRQTVLDAYAHQDMPFEQVVEEVQPTRDLSRNPLAQVSFAYHNLPSVDAELTNGRLTPYDHAPETVRFDLEVHLWDADDGGLAGSCLYYTDLFAAATVERLMEHFVVVLEACGTYLARRMSDLPVMTAAEHRLVVEEFNRTTTDYPRDHTLVELLEAQVDRTPAGAAVVHGAQRLTYSALNARVNQLARFLRRRGVGVDTPVVMLETRGIEMVVSMCGILKAGGAYVPIDLEMPAARVLRMIQECGSTLILSRSTLTSNVVQALRASGHTVLFVDAAAADIAREDVTNPVPINTPTDLAYVMYTSGSTGTPKGIMITHRNVVNLVRQTNYTSIRPSDHLLQLSNYAFDGSTFDFFGGLLNGACVHLIDAAQVHDVAELGALIAAQGVNVTFMTTALFNQLVDLAPEVIRHFDRLYFGGQEASVRHVRTALPYRKSDDSLVHVYGPTEATTFSTYHVVKDVPGDAVAIPIGAPISRSRAYVLDAWQQPVPIGVEGELHIGGDGIARGYVNDPSLTAERFVRNPFVSSERMYRTGDRAKWLPDGQIVFLGRQDDQVKIRGFRIEPGDIEAALRAFPAVRDAVVTPHVGRGGTHELIGYVALNPGQLLDRRALRQFLKERLPEYMLPAALVELPALPLTPNGKVDRRALPVPETCRWDDGIAEIGTGPLSPTESVMENIWAAVLHLDMVGRHADFFELGGHSLLATQVVSRIREVFQVELPLRQIFETPTIAGLTEAIERLRAADSGLTAPPMTQRPHDGPVPLSFAQERLWFLEQLVPGNPFYNTPLAIELHGRLDEQALRLTLDTLVQRHEALRTTIATLDGRPQQVVHPPHAVTLAVEDVTALPEDARIATARASAYAESRRPFDLTQGPLLRATLVRFSPTHHLLLLTMHHIVSDGWSLGVLFRELTILYTALSQGETPELPSLPVQYADFAAWQRAWLQGDVLDAQRQHWRAALQHAPLVLELPADHPRPPVHTFRGSAEAFSIAPELVAQLRRLSQAASASLYMTFLSAFAILLARYAGVEELLIGSPIANRTRQELEPLIGFFVNTLALRIDLRGNPSFLTLLRRVRQITLDAYAHQDVPFEQIVDDLQPERDMSRTPVVQVSLAYQNAPISDVGIPGLTLQPYPFETGTVRFDIELHVWEEPSGALTGSCLYYAEIFDAETIRRLMTNFTTLLANIVANPEQPVAEVSLLTEADHHQLLVGWNTTAAPYQQHTTVARLFAAQAESTPDAVAVVAGPERLTYRELNTRANRLANHLRSLGVGPDVLVGVCVERSVAMVVGLLGVLKAGGAYVPLDPAYPSDRLQYMAADARMPVVLTQQRFAPLFASGALKVICLETDWSAIAGFPATDPDVPVMPDHLAYVIYTSGSTGRPKGTMIPHRGLVNYLSWCTRAYRVADGQGAPVHSSISFDATITSLFAPLVVGRAVILIPERQEIDALRDVLQARGDFSLVKITPAHLDLLRELLPPQPMTGQARTFVIGGEALLGSQLSFWQTYAPDVHLINEYGPTETVVGCCVFDAKGHAPFPGPVPIGRPIANTRLYLLDERLQPVPIGVYGELYISGDGLARGYLGRPDVTADRFVPSPFSSTAGARMYRTGDVARYLLDGNLEYQGRRDHQIKIRGHRIEPEEIEVVLAAHPAVRDAVVLAREDQAGDARLVAYVVPAAEGLREPADATVSPIETQQVNAWQQVFQDSYSHSAASADITFDITGWNSSYTGLPIPAAEMREWVEQTVARILALQPAHVLEIGCGTGLLVARIAPQCQSYWGTDFSHVAVRHVRQMKAAFPWGDRVTLLHRPADDFSGLADGQFDTVVINSVAQYFPSVDYLLQVISGALRVLRPGGALFLGDLRSLPLLDAFHASVQVAKSAPDVTVLQLRQQIRQQTLQEEELVIDPALFAALPQQYPSITAVDVQYKRGQALNELTKFRYDVVLTVGARVPSAPDVEWHDWPTQSMTVAELRAWLAGSPSQRLGLRRVPNARLRDERAMLIWLRQAEATATVAAFHRRQPELAPDGLDPEQLWRVGAEHGFVVRVVPDEGSLEGSYSAVFLPQAAPAPPPRPQNTLPQRPWSAYANNPLRRRVQSAVIPELRRYLADRVPTYMIPAAYVLLDAFPLTPNGKVDRRALPAPDSAASVGQTGDQATRTPTEEVVAAIWADVLSLERVGLQDNFFHLGGHSLLATQVVSRLRDVFAVELPLRQMFDTPTVADFSARLEALTREQQGLPGPPPLRPADRTAPLPLSFAQERLWFLDQLEGPNATYNSPVAVRMTGHLDVQALEDSVTAIGNRHETLRTTFATGSDGRPLQRIAPDIRIALPVLDLQSANERERRLDACLAQEATEPFDLARGPLLRGTLLRIAPDDHLLLLTMHHIVSDAWSAAVFVRELAALYTAAVRRTPVTLPPLPIQYGDFAVWQRQWLQGDVLAAQLAYWRAHLEGIPPLLELPTDRPRPAVQTFRGSSCPVEFDPGLTRDLTALSQRAGVSLFMTLLAAFAALLGRYSGTDDLVVGSPIANRNRSETEGLIGFFVNTLALRIDLAGRPSFLDLLARVRQIALDAYTHQDVPFEVVVEALQPERHLSHHPVFQTMFVLQNTPAERLELPELTLTPVPQEHQTAKFDLLLSLTELDGRLKGWLEYSTDLFEAATIRRMIGHLTRLLAEAVASPDRPVSQLTLLTEAERRQALRWNQTAQPFPPFSVAQMFEAQVERTPDAVALEFPRAAGGEDQQLTYLALNARANQLARHLRQRGAAPDVPIGVSLDRSTDLLVAVLAILKAGSPYVPLDPTYPAERLAMMCAASGAPLVVTRDWLANEQAAIARCSSANLEHVVEPDHLAYVLYTSGSTGAPKGVGLCHRALSNLLLWQAAHSAAAVGTKTLQFTSLSFDVSFQETFATWCTGGRLVQIADDLRRDGRELLRVLAEERVERLFLPFVALQQLAVSAQETGTVPVTLREVITAGEQLQISPALVWLFTQLPDCRLHNHYGPSETHVVTAYPLAGPPADWPALPPIGRPIANTHVVVLEEHGDVAPVGVPGDLYAGGACLARGYWRQPDLTAERFVPCPVTLQSSAGGSAGGEGGTRLYRTGDRARYLADGNIEFLGRRDQQVKIRGFRVEPGEIEAVLSTHPDVQEAVVAAHATAAGFTRLVAYVVPAAGRTLTTEHVRQFAKSTLPEYMVPAVILPLARLPLTPSGKVNRRALPAPELTGQPADASVLRPRDTVELRLMRIWEEVLERSPVGVHDNFFDLGGHSLLAVRLMAYVQQQFGRHLPLSALFQRPTVAQLGELLRQQGDAAPWPILVPIRPGTGASPFFCVPGAGGNVVYFAGLARLVDRPFYGLQAVGLDGRASPQTRIQDVAATYVEALRHVQPQGPYWIGGHSFGGWVAFEMAQQLQQQGHAVALLVIFDTPAPPRHEPLAAPIKEDAAWLVEITAVIGSLFGRPLALETERLQALPYEDQLRLVHHTLTQAEIVPPDTGLHLLRGFVEVYKAHVVAMTRYVAPAAVVPTPIRLVRAQDADPLTGLTAGGATPDADLGWAAFADGPFEPVFAPGDHRTMLNAPAVEVVARYLRRWLEHGSPGTDRSRHA
ncbi:MAG: non-ribosomal peptide synthase/polyketide synthase [Acidobacteriota bacterium]